VPTARCSVDGYDRWISRCVRRLLIEHLVIDENHLSMIQSASKPKRTVSRVRAEARGLRPVHATLIAVGCVVAAATLGQVLAGSDPRARLDDLDTTTLALPFAAWIVVAVVYYLIAIAVIYRLARRLSDANSALAGVLCMLLANEAWNALLFGFDSVTPAAIGMVLFASITIVTGVMVFKVDRVAGWVLAPYVVWVVLYDVPWILAVWRNSTS